MKVKGSLYWIYSFISGCKGKMLVAILLAVIGVLCGMAPYFALAGILSGLIQNTLTAERIFCYVGIAVLGETLKMLFNTVSSLKAHRVAYHILGNIRCKLAEKMMRVPMGVMVDTPSGKLKAMVVDTVDKLEQPLAHMLPEITANVFTPLCIIILLFILDWRMALACMIVIPIGVLLLMGQMKDYKNRSDRYIEASSNMDSSLVEYVNGIEVIKTFSQTGKSFQKFSDSVKNYHDTTLDWWKNTWLYSALGLTVIPATLVGGIPVGAYLLMQGSISFSIYITCLILSLGIAGPLIQATYYADNFAVVDASIRQVGNFLDEQELVRPSKEVLLTDDGFHFEYVSFGYDKKEVAGTYEYIYHEPSTAGGSVVNSTYITLYENGTVGGVDAGGTWSMKSGKPYVDFTIKGVKYQGVFSYGYDESAARNRVMTFTAVGANNVCIWGSKTLKDPKTESGSVTADSNAITVPSSATADFDLPLGGAYGSTVSWKVTAADNAVAVQGSKAVVKRHLKDGSATLTATITKGTSSATKTYKVTVPGLLNDIQIETVVKSDSITLPKTLNGGYAISWTSSDTSVINPATGAVTRPAAESKDVTLTATVTGNGETETKGFSVKVLTKGDIQYLYTQDYESVTDITTLFASANMAGGISLGTENDNHFLKFAQDSSSGNRGGKAADFGITAEQSSYIVEMDVALTSGNVANRSQSQLVLTSTDSTTDKANNNGGMADADAYILKLDTTQNTTGQLQTDWYINGTQNKLTIPSGTWVHLQVEVNVTAKTLKVVATNGDTVLGTVDNVAFTGNGTPKGFYVLSGRGSGVTQIDNIKVQ